MAHSFKVIANRYIKIKWLLIKKGGKTGTAKTFFLLIINQGLSIL